MRTLVVVGLAASPMSTGAMPASRHALRQRRRRLVLAGHRDQRGAAAERRDVVRDVGGAADPMAFMVEHHDRHRRFRRDARDASRDELVEHRVADDEDVGAAEAGGDRPRPVRRERGQHRLSRRRERQRDQDEEEHQELGVAEVVFEEAGREHAGGRRERHRREHTLALLVRRGRRPEHPEQRHDQSDRRTRPTRRAPAGRARRRSAAARCAGAG